jgi:hypothetical protein
MIRTLRLLTVTLVALVVCFNTIGCDKPASTAKPASGGGPKMDRKDDKMSDKKDDKMSDKKDDKMSDKKDDKMEKKDK